MKVDRVYLVCLIHSQEGRPVLAEIRPLPGDAILARCPACIKLGQSILERHANGEAVPRPIPMPSAERVNPNG